MSRERVEPVVDHLIPEGFEVTFHILTGVFLVDRWFETKDPEGVVRTFGCRDEAINSCVRHAEGDPPGPPEGSIEHDWRDLRGEGYQGCVSCGVRRSKDGSEVQWRCSVCHGRVCMECTLKVDDRMYYEKTYCSRACWERDGSPRE